MTIEHRHIHYACVATGLLVLLSAWNATLVHMMGILWSVDVFAHGLLAPFVSAALIWSRRKQFDQVPLTFSGFGLLILLAACFFWIGGKLFDVALLSHFGLVTAIQAIVIGMLGLRAYQAVLFPMLLLFFMVPFGYELVYPLQVMTAGIVVQVLDIIGADYTSQGMLISLPSGLYEVAEACAGVKFLFTSFFTGVLLAHLVFENWRSRIVLVLFSIGLPIIANALRVLLILLIAELSDQKLAKGFDHLVYGWVFLSFVLLLLITTAYRFSDKPLSSDHAPVTLSNSSRSEMTKPRLWLPIAMISLPLAGLALAPNTQVNIEESLQRQTVLEPLIAGDMKGYRVLNDTGLVVRPKFRSATGQKGSLLRKNGSVFYAYTAQVEDLSSGRRIFQPGNGLVNGEWRLVDRSITETETCSIPFQESVFVRGADSMMTWSTYFAGKDTVFNGVEEKISTARQSLFKDEIDGYIIVLSAPLVTEKETVRKIFSQFVSTFPLDSYLTINGGPVKKDGAICAE